MRTGAACRCSAKRICTNFVSSEPLVLFSAFNISANLRSAALTNALRCRRIVSVCVFKRAKRGRFAYFSLKLALIRLTPAPPGRGILFCFCVPALKRRPIFGAPLRGAVGSTHIHPASHVPVVSVLKGRRLLCPRTNPLFRALAFFRDALDSKSSTGNSVWVRSPPSASVRNQRFTKAVSPVN